MVGGLRPEILHCHTGLASRVTAMVNALARWPQIEVAWQVNEHCPAPHKAIFPGGVPGVRWIDDAPPSFMTRFEDRRTCDVYRPHPDSDGLYRRVLEALAGAPPRDGRAVAVCARFFRHQREASISALAVAAACCAKSAGCDEVFLMADAHRETLANWLAVYGIRAVLPRVPELRHDLDRNATDLLTFCSDWKHLLAADAIVTSAFDTALLHPARAAGTSIVQGYL